MFENSLYQDLFDKHVSGSGLLTAIRNARNFVFRQRRSRLGLVHRGDGGVGS
jgi:hypothetical protein